MMTKKLGLRSSRNAAGAARSGMALSALVLSCAAILRADAVLDWNITALKTTAAAPFNPPVESRNLAIVHAAMFDAVNSISGEFHPYEIKLRATGRASAEAAAAAAAHYTLAKLYPEQRPTLAAALAVSLASIPDGPAKVDGIAVGEAVAARILARRASDGADIAVTAAYHVGSQPGDWSPTPPAFRPPLDPGWGKVRPFFLRSASQFRPEPPPPLTSRQYTRDFSESKEIGSAASPTRSRQQTDLANFWVSTAPQIWNPAARQAAAAQGLTLSQNARAFALLNLAGADAFIASWDAKFAYNQWRPVTAIRAADSDGNAATSADSEWMPLLATPPFPDYIAGHTSYAGAAQEVLEHLFGGHPGLVIRLASVTAPGVIMTYSTFADIADGAVDARVLGGIHWRTSSSRGKQMGEQIGAYAVRSFLKPRAGRRDVRRK